MKFQYVFSPCAVALISLSVSLPAFAQQGAAPAAPVHRGFFSKLFSHPAATPAATASAMPLHGQGFVQQTAAPAPAPAPAPAAQQTTTAPAAGQTEQPDQPYKLVVRTSEVNLVFTVTDKKGKFITGLKREDLGLLDDGRPPAAVINFTQQTNLPLRLGVMLDTSSSIRQRFKFEQEAAIDFFLQVLHTNDRAFIEGFDIRTNLPQDFTNNVSLLDEGIRKLRPGGGTALFDALYSTCKDEMLTLREQGAVRKAIILVSDGDDNYSRAYLEDAIKMCERSETIVYTISTDTSPSKGKGGDTLRKLAEATGGQAFYPNKIEDVAIGFRNIEEELRSQYLLEYRPAELKMDGSFRTIYLQSRDPKYHVRAKTGYFSPRAEQ